MMLKKILVYGGVGLLLAAGAGAGAYFFLAGRDSGGRPQAEEGEAPRDPAATQVNQYDDYPMADEDDSNVVAVNQTHVINLPGSRSGFLKCQISVFIRDPELGRQMSSDTPTPEREESKAIVLEILNTLSAEEVRESETQLTLRQDIMDRLNERFRPTRPPADKKSPPRPRRPIKDVFIIEWAVQL